MGSLQKRNTVVVDQWTPPSASLTSWVWTEQLESPRLPWEWRWVEEYVRRCFWNPEFQGNQSTEHGTRTKQRHQSSLHCWLAASCLTLEYCHQNGPNPISPWTAAEVKFYCQTSLNSIKNIYLFTSIKHIAASLLSDLHFTYLWQLCTQQWLPGVASARAFSTPSFSTLQDLSTLFPLREYRLHSFATQL